MKYTQLIIVSEYFYPNNTSTGKVLTELAEDLSEYGMEIEVFTSRILYVTGEKKLSNVETYKGIKINRIWSTNYNKDKSIGRLINQFTFTLNLLIKLLFTNKKKKILFVSNPPVAPFVGTLMKIFKGQDYFYLIHDMYPDIAVAMKVVKEKSIFVKTFNTLNRFIFRFARKIIVLGIDMKEVLVKKGVPDEKISIVTNWADKSKLKINDKRNDFSEGNNLHDKFVVLYTGNMGRFHNLEILVDVAEKLEKIDEIVVVFIGEGYRKKKLEYIVKKRNMVNVKFFPYQSEEIYGDVLSTGDILVASLENGAEGLAVPSKTYSYLAASKPILGIMKNDTEIGKLILENQLGINVEGNDVEAITRFIINMYYDKHKSNILGRNARKIFEEKYERKIVTKKFFEAIQSEV